MKQAARILFAAALILSQTTGCSDGGDGGSSNGPPPMDSGMNNTTPTFTELYTTILGPSCAAAFCHGTPVGGMLVMANRDIAYQGLVNQMAMGVSPVDGGIDCATAGFMRVVPGEPEMSLLYLKLMSSPPCGDQMPIVGLLPPEDIEKIRLWIEAGALDN